MAEVAALILLILMSGLTQEAAMTQHALILHQRRSTCSDVLKGNVYSSRFSTIGRRGGGGFSLFWYGPDTVGS
jgi:hypothetical protein